MDISGILIATAIVGGVGLFLGLFLGVASIVFKVEVNEKEEAVLAALPGNNCGGCGYPGCAGLAAAIAAHTPDTPPPQTITSYTLSFFIFTTSVYPLSYAFLGILQS